LGAPTFAEASARLLGLSFQGVGIKCRALDLTRTLGSFHIS
jgi:hypothetical protein